VEGGEPWTVKRFFEGSSRGYDMLALPFQAVSPRFKQIAHSAPNIWMHHLELLDAGQLDHEGGAADAPSVKSAA
jgi:hypothetical protein